jgi:hypothetical protein
LADPAFDLEHLTADDMAAIGRDLRLLGNRASHRQAVAERIVRYLHDSFRVPATAEPACVLVRCFQTCPYAGLPLEYQYAAEELLEAMPSRPEMSCLALLATCGSKLVWNDVATSVNHQSIPLPSVEVVKRAPMIARLLGEIGVPLERVVTPPGSPDFLLERAADCGGGPALDIFNVFYVEHALNSPFIPAQDDFVKPFGVHSVLGVGGLLPDGELFVVLLFLRIPVSRRVAELFRALALSVKAAMLNFPADKTFEKSRG